MKATTTSLICTMLFLAACDRQVKTADKVRAPADTPSVAAVGTGDGRSWMDTILPYYVAHASQPSVRQAAREGVTEAYLFDQVGETDSVRYLIYRIGHTESDEGGANPRFVTDMWLHLDTARKRVFEYDLPNDTLLLWRR